MSDEPDPLDEITEPNDAEIAEAARVEAADATDQAKKDAKKSAAARRGPGRPPGAKNKSAATKDATTRAASTRTSSAAPRSTPAAALPTGNSDLAAAREARRRVRDARNVHVEALTGEMLKKRIPLVRAVGTATGIPPQFLVAIEGDEAGHPIIDGDTGRPREILTHYGQALAPADWQVRTCVEAWVRLEESEQGQKLLDSIDRLMPMALMLGGVAAVGMYALTVMQASAAIKPMVAIELQQQADAAAAAAQQAAAQQGTPTPGATSGGGAPG